MAEYELLLCIKLWTVLYHCVAYKDTTCINKLWLFKKIVKQNEPVITFLSV